MFKKEEVRDEVGRFLTQALFKQQYAVSKEKYPPKFTFKDHDHDGLISFKRVYLELGDPTGYLCAMELLDSYAHLKHLRTLKWFEDYFKEWEEELEVKLRAESLRKVKDISQSNDKGALTAAKYLAEKGWEPKPTTTRGRPKKEEVEREKKLQAATERALEDDFNRVMN